MMDTEGKEKETSVADVESEPLDDSPKWVKVVRSVRSVDTNQVVCENIMLHNCHRLNDHDLLVEFMHVVRPEKLHLNVLCEVFEQFFSAMTCYDKLCKGNIIPKEYVYFQYDGKMWKGSFNGAIVNYAGKPVHFTMIR